MGFLDQPYPGQPIDPGMPPGYAPDPLIAALLAQRAQAPGGLGYDPASMIDTPGALPLTSQDQASGMMGKLATTWPARLAQSAWSGFTLPHDVYHGDVDLNSDEGMGRVLDLAGLAVGAPVAFAPERAAGETVLGSGAIRPGAVSSGMASEVPPAYARAYQIGQKYGALQKQGFTDTDILYGDMLGKDAPDSAMYGNHAENAFFEMGRRGHPMPEQTTGMRFGGADAEGRSHNYADDKAELGVSFAKVAHPSAADYEWYNMGGSSGEPRHYRGWLLGERGSENEPLMVGLQKIDPSEHVMPTPPFPAPNSGSPASGGMLAAEPPSITAYHGSPHDFDKFDISKIGTGEGAQAYGHGLYFAGNEGVARSYRDALAGAPKVPDSVLQSAAGETPLDAHHLSFIRNLSSATAKTPEQIAVATQGMFPGLRDPGGSMMSQVADGPKFKALTSAARALDTEKPVSPGHMYQVQINADPEHFLDWDKPLSEQHPKVQEALQGLGYDGGKYDLHVAGPDENSVFTFNSRAEAESEAAKWREGGDHTVNLYNRDDLPPMAGSEIYHDLSLSGRPGKSMDATAQKLREAGIPGIKYLDAGSRGNVNAANIKGITDELSLWQKAAQNAPDNTYAQSKISDLTKQLEEAKKPQTRNYVTFSDDIISILKKYGLAGLGLAGYGAAQSQTNSDNSRQ